MKIALPLLVLCASLNAAAITTLPPPPPKPGPVILPNFGQIVSNMAHARNEARKAAKDSECAPAKGPVARPSPVLPMTQLWSDTPVDLGDGFDEVVLTPCDVKR